MDKINIGCGNRFHEDWLNVDIIPYDKTIKRINVSKGLPFESEKFHIVYHSHVLEHLSKEKGAKFLKDCNRILKKGGILRMAVPDLEKIVREYLLKVEKGMRELGNENNRSEYDWVMLELFDQCVRSRRGGEMIEFMRNSKGHMRNYIVERVGKEAEVNFKESEGLGSSKMKKFLALPIGNKIGLLVDLFFSVILPGRFGEIYSYGSFKRSGEVHQWMYDRFSISVILKELGFGELTFPSAFESRIKNWKNYNLDGELGVAHKPDSLYIEAVKL